MKYIWVVEVNVKETGYEWNVGILHDLVKANLNRFFQGDPNEWSMIGFFDTQEAADSFCKEMKKVSTATLGEILNEW